MAVRIVTDSTSDMPQNLAEEMGIAIAPARVYFGMEEFKDRLDISTDEFYDRLTNGPVLPKTSQPSVGELIEIYEQLGQDADGIVSLQPSSKVAGNFEAAVWAKEQAKVECPIEVIDTLQISMGIGLPALAAAEAARQGSGMEDVVRTARSAVERSQSFALLDTLEYLEKGGRIGKAQSLLGTILRIKPLIIARDGIAHELGKERSRQRGMSRLQQIAKEFAPIEKMAVSYTTSSDDAYILADSLRELLPDGKEPLIVRIGPVIGTYAGPGALGISLLRSD